MSESRSDEYSTKISVVIDQSGFSPWTCSTEISQRHFPVCFVVTTLATRKKYTVLNYRFYAVFDKEMEALRHRIPRCILLVVMYIKLARTSPPCSWTQITQVNGNVTSCWDCPKCPHGFGLTPQCASYITIDVPIECVPCKDGVTYSDSYDIASCKPCSICGDNEITIRRCNVTHNAICGKCKPGFYRAITEDCWPCTKCCPDSTSDHHEPQCLFHGLPAKQSCRLDFDTEACAKLPTTKPTITTERASPHSCHSNVVNSTIIVVQYYHTTTSSQLWMGVGIAMLVIFAVGIPVVLVILCRRRRFNHHSFSYLIEREKGFDFHQPLSVV